MIDTTQVRPGTQVVTVPLFRTTRTMQRDGWQPWAPALARVWQGRLILPRWARQDQAPTRFVGTVEMVIDIDGRVWTSEDFVTDADVVTSVAAPVVPPIREVRLLTNAPVMDLIIPVAWIDPLQTPQTETLVDERAV